MDAYYPLAAMREGFLYQAAIAVLKLIYIPLDVPFVPASKRKRIVRTHSLRKILIFNPISKSRCGYQ